ncbi:MAG: hypothetical protein L0322_05495 [Chloroflexi bacterium]|nr:hypothetical protein [Chloroflexota bacterium]MCI0577459.1 hypothetical protein [Chloroflexota bacterium]
MDLFEEKNHSFILRIWRENSDDSPRWRAAWRGHIKHVPSGEQRYLQSLEEIPLFVVPYLEQMGVRVSLYWRLRSWWRQRKWALKRPKINPG